MQRAAASSTCCCKPAQGEEQQPVQSGYEYEFAGIAVRCAGLVVGVGIIGRIFVTGGGGGDGQGDNLLWELERKYADIGAGLGKGQQSEASSSIGQAGTAGRKTTPRA